MRTMKTKRVVASALLAASLAVSGPGLASAQTITDALVAESPSDWSTGDAYVEPTTSGKQKSKAKAKGSSTPEMKCEAQERSKARTAKLLADGTPELFGSEEPFTFSPSVC